MAKGRISTRTHLVSFSPMVFRVSVYMYDCAYDCVAKDGTIWLARMEQKHVVMLPKQ